MLEWFDLQIQAFYTATRASPLLAAVAMPVVAAVLYFLKDIPIQIKNFFTRITLVTLTLNNAGWEGNIDAYNAFDRWFSESGFTKWSRRFFLFRKYDNETDVNFKPFRMGVGNGTHFFIYSGKLYWITKGNLDSSGSERQKEEIVITTFGRGGKTFEVLIEMFNKPRDKGGAITFHNWGAANNSWEETRDVIPRALDTVCINNDTKNEIIKQISDFIEKKETYRKKGLTYKLSTLFHGPVGTGKTSLCKSIAGYFGKDLYLLDLTTVTNASLLRSLSAIKPGSIVLLEDVDEAGSAVKSRESKKDDPLSMLDCQPLTMSGFLNAIDGVCNLDNIIIFMTTNHPEVLDPAVRRKSRIDYEFLIDLMSEKEIVQYVNVMYSDSEQDIEPILDQVSRSKIQLAGCEVENVYKENFDSPKDFVDEILKRNKKLRVA